MSVSVSVCVTKWSSASSVIFFLYFDPFSTFLFHLWALCTDGEMAQKKNTLLGSTHKLYPSVVTFTTLNVTVALHRHGNGQIRVLGSLYLI